MCESKVQGSTYTQYGRHICPDGYTEHYSGYVMGGHHGHYRTHHICVDKKTEKHPWGGTSSQDHGLLYAMEIECSNPLLCSSEAGYTHNREVTCSVCTKPLVE